MAATHLFWRNLVLWVESWVLILAAVGLEPFPIGDNEYIREREREKYI